MKTYCPIFWPNSPNIDHRAPTVALEALLPSVPGTAFAHFDKDDQPCMGETIRLIWCPPVSDLNGWSEQPSEIASSYLLTARVISPGSAAMRTAEDANFALIHTQRYQLEILSRERLIPALEGLAQGTSTWSLHTIWTEEGSMLAWDEVSWCGKSTVEGLTYLVANTRNEAHMELLLEQTGEELTGLFSSHMTPGGTHYGLGRKRFTAQELQAVKHALNIARPLHDTQPAYLTGTSTTG
ncbi:hypothetical protein M2262_003700 [Pseudomonas sp. BIGb0408]|uniref:Uncharacterized protein n=1 Tax=Phytopseudomonas flavescens TaxID=29435 RepID=A0A7Z0BP52_9GAMM|nr:hypothetical protein [Pseudomonas sp. BIGb0408]MCW2293650.1 hypothetical protein [Pseudomonas sp. BIGb0408]NYH71781.1 hypothetical protein [Pseudomonas flavescens]